MVGSWVPLDEVGEREERLESWSRIFFPAIRAAIHGAASPGSSPRSEPVR
jgi:hypothetical protein